MGSLQQTYVCRCRTNAFFSDQVRGARRISKSKTYSLLPEFLLCHCSLTRLIQKSCQSMIRDGYIFKLSSVSRGEFQRGRLSYRYRCASRKKVLLASKRAITTLAIVAGFCHNVDAPASSARQSDEALYTYAVATPQ